MDLKPSIKTVVQEEEELEYIGVPEIFSYQYFQTHRYEISQLDGYQCLCNNGWIKFFTLKTRVYWHAQNQFSHRVPDWKFHVSVSHEDLKKAWDLIIGMFIKMKCRAGVKVIYLKQSVNPQPGRQITIYIVKYSKSFQKSTFANDYEISIADQHSQDFWIQMIIQIQRVLTAHQIKTNGLAQGDLKVGKYTSLRNEAFVLGNDGNYIYPTNSHGWNHQNHKPPFNISFLIKQVTENQQEFSEEKKRKSILPYLTLPIMILSFGFVWLKRINKY